MAWIDLDGAVNVRDLGGLPTDDGRQTAPGVLLRSDNLQDLSPADVATLVDGIGLTTVVDLRSNAETELRGTRPAGCRALRRAPAPVGAAGGRPAH